jgi:8-oxo-dGTP diphosphatase
VRRGDEVLLVRQGLPGEEPHWSLPGGVLEEGELVGEGLAREVLEETGVEIVGAARLAFALQIDNRRSEPLRAGRDEPVGYLATVWVLEVEGWKGDVVARDPEAVVSEAAFVPLDQAIRRLRTVPWHALTVSYLLGELEPGSLHLQRWHPDGHIELLA